MKRTGNLYWRICSVDNLIKADSIARKGKLKQPGVLQHDREREANIQALHVMLRDKTYKTSEYTTFTIFEPKERLIFRLPYYPDRITHHAVMNVLEPVFVSIFTADTFSCIKKRGIHAAANAVKDALKDATATTYCLKLDIKKFYPSVDHEVLKQLLRRKFKDNDLLWLLDEIIDSTDGLPIGNYLSQYLANFYLTYFDHWLKETKHVKYYLRYADDMVILSGDKQYLHDLLKDIKQYLNDNLKLTVKGNHQVFPVDDRGIDFVGYVFRHTHVLLRKSIKKDFARMMVGNKNRQSMASYYGWLAHCNSYNLLKKFDMIDFKELKIKAPDKGFEGDKIKMQRLVNRQIIVHKYKIEDSKVYKDRGTGKCLQLQVSLNGEKHVVFTSASGLIDVITQIEEANFPFQTTIVKEGERFLFT
jgi:retron-type reverse transcriptase